MWQFLRASQARSCRIRGWRRQLCFLRGVEFSWNWVSIPLHGGECGKSWNFPQENILRTKCLRDRCFYYLFGFFLWLIYHAAGKFSPWKWQSFSKPQNYHVLQSEIPRKRIFNILSFFSRFPKLKVTISSHSFIKPSDFICCVFPAAHWSVKSFLTNFT